MKKFMDENFILSNDTAVKLYHDFAKDMPIYDYHCHLNPKEILEDKTYKNITEIWLYGDHYKWRAMRSNGIDEKYITGDASDYDKFMAWAKTIQNCIGNPLYHWTHLELQRYFDIEEPLSEKTADAIWNKCNEVLNSGEFTARQIIKQSNVKLIGTTDDPIDSLEYHQKLNEEENLDVKVVPAFRPDKAVNITKDEFADYINKLAEVVGNSIDTYEDLLKALEERINFFHETGCRISDHGLDYVCYREASLDEVSKIFEKAMKKEAISLDEEEKYKTHILAFFGRMYSERNWVMQLHIGALRNNNTSMFKKLGPDTGFDAIEDREIASALARFLDLLNEDNKLPKTILYTLNPKDNYVLGTMLGNFQGDGIPGKMQFGSGWWFNDHKEGMIRQMTDLANLGLLSKFVGMLTDSRSYLSYTRHEYFRRILCNLIGEWVENGEFPMDMALLEKIVKDICYNNSKNYFGIEL